MAIVAMDRPLTEIQPKSPRAPPSTGGRGCRGWFFVCATITIVLLSVFMAMTVGTLQFQTLPLLIVGPSDRVKNAGSCPTLSGHRQVDHKRDYDVLVQQMQHDKTELVYSESLHQTFETADDVRTTFRAQRVVHIPRSVQDAATPVDEFQTGKFCHRHMKNDSNMTQWTCLDCGSSPLETCREMPRRGRCLDAAAASERDLQRRGKFGRTTENLDLPDPRAVPSHSRPSRAYGMGTTSLAHFKKPETYSTMPCTMDNPDCFNLTKCPSFTSPDDSGPLLVYPRGNPNGEAMKILMEAVELAPDVVQRAEKPDDACVLLLGVDSYPNSKELFRLENWDEGRNHFVWHSPTIFEGFGDFPFHQIHFQMAALVSGTLTDAHVRPGFDFVMPLPAKWRRPRQWDHLELHRPRKYLVTFKGGMKPLPPVYYQHRWLAAEYWPQDDPEVVVDVDCDDLGYELDSPDAFGESLLNATFVFCPGGNGVSSYRFAEALMADAIPVVTSNHLQPLYPEVDWSECVVQVSEARIVDLPRLLRLYTPQQVQQRQVKCRAMFDLWIGKTSFFRKETQEEVWMRPPHWTPFFIGVAKTYRFRIAQAHLQRKAAQERNAMR